MSSSYSSRRRGDEWAMMKRDRAKVRSSAHELLAIVDEMSLRKSPPKSNDAAVPTTRLPSSRFLGDPDEESGSGKRRRSAARAKKRPSLIGKAWNFLSDDNPELVGLSGIQEEGSKRPPSLDQFDKSKRYVPADFAAVKKKNRPTVVLIGSDRPGFYKEGSKPAVALGHGRIVGSSDDSPRGGSGGGIFGGWKKSNDDNDDFANINIATRRESKDSIELAQMLAEFSSDDESDEEEEPLWDFRGETAAAGGYEHYNSPPPFNLKRSVILVAIATLVFGTVLAVSIVAVEVAGNHQDSGSSSSGHAVPAPAPAPATTVTQADKQKASDFQSVEVGAASPQSASAANLEHGSSSSSSSSSSSGGWRIPHPQPADHDPFGPPAKGQASNSVQPHDTGSNDPTMQASFQQENQSALLSSPGSTKDTAATAGTTARTTKNRCGLNWLDATRACPMTSCNHSSECLGDGENCWQAITCMEGSDAAAASSLSEEPSQEP